MELVAGPVLGVPDRSHDFDLELFDLAEYLFGVLDVFRILLQFKHLLKVRQRPLKKSIALMQVGLRVVLTKLLKGNAPAIDGLGVGRIVLQHCGGNIDSRPKVLEVVVTVCQVCLCLCEILLKKLLGGLDVFDQLLGCQIVVLDRLLVELRLEVLAALVQDPHDLYPFFLLFFFFFLLLFLIFSLAHKEYIQSSSSRSS